MTASRWSAVLFLMLSLKGKYSWERADIRCDFPKNLIFLKGALYSLAFCIFMMFSCGRLNAFSSKSESTAVVSIPEPTAIPPVPVTGSYLTTILMDEFSKPIAQADVYADANQFSTRTNDKGVFALPVRLVKDNAIELDLKINGQSLFLMVQLPVDIADAAQNAVPAAATELPRTLGIRIAHSQIPSSNAPGKRFAAETLSLPVQFVQSLAANTTALLLSITSQKNGDVVQSLVRLTGRCDAGFTIRVTGDLDVILDTLCLNSVGQGIFDATVKLAQPDGLKSVTVTQTHPQTGEYVSQLLLLNSVNLPPAPTLTAANVSGLMPILAGTCDSSEYSMQLETTLRLGTLPGIIVHNTEPERSLRA